MVCEYYKNCSEYRVENNKCASLLDCPIYDMRIFEKEQRLNIKRRASKKESLLDKIKYVTIKK